MSKKPRRRAASPSPATLLLDWFTDLATDAEVIHEIVDSGNPLNNPPEMRITFQDQEEVAHHHEGDRGVWGGRGTHNLEIVDKPIPHSTVPDARGCHSTLQEHKHAELRCAHTLKVWEISNPWYFLERWTTGEILGVLDVMAGLFLQGTEFDKPGGYLFTLLTADKGGCRVHL